MTEDILNAAVQKLRAAALEQYALIKDVYHQPATGDTVNIICNAASQLAQLEGAMITLQQYSEQLATRTPAEILASGEEVPTQPTEPEQVEEQKLTHEDLMERSSTYRNSQSVTRKPSKKRKGKSKSES